MRAILAAFVISLAAAACGDPTLSVKVEIDGAYRATVATVALADYEKADLDCDAIAFGDESAQALDGALTTQVETRPGQAVGLVGVSRVDHKVLVARGLDDHGNPLVAGCAAVDVVDGNRVVTITTVPIAIATLDARHTDTPLDPAVPLTLHVIGAHGEALANRAVVWRVFGPKGLPGGTTATTGCARAGVDGCTTTTAAGDATVPAAPPALPGPTLVQIHVAWAAAQPAPAGAFALAQTSTFPLADGAVSPPSSCVIAHLAPGVRVVCLAMPVGGGVEVRRYGWTGSAMALLPGAPAVPGAIALIAVPDGATDRVLAITTAGDFVDVATSLVAGHAAFPGLPVAARVVPACGKTPFVVVGFASGVVRSYTTTGADLASFVASPASRRFELAATGCIGEIAAAATSYRAVVLTETKANGSVVPFAQVDCPTATCAPTWPGFGAVGFLASGPDDLRLAAGQLTLSGAVVTEWLLDASAADPGKQLVSPRTHDAISVPQAIAGGDLDGDGAADRLWLTLGLGPRLPGRVEIELAATAGPGGAVIAGVSPPIGPGPTDVITARLDDDATDDLAVMSSDAVTFVLTGRTP